MIKKIFIFFLIFVSTMLLIEGFIRSSHIATVSSTEFYEDIGRGRRKNLNYLYFNEGFGIGKFNKYRYIGESNGPIKVDKTIRVALIGDSYVESFQIFNRDYFGNIAENILSEHHPETKFEFLNFGRSGFDIANMYAYHKTFVDYFEPDFVFYMVSNRDLIPVKTDKLRPQLIIQNDSLVIEMNFNKEDIKAFMNTKILTQNSAIMKMVDNCRRKIETTPFFEIILDKMYFRMSPKEIELSKGKSLYLNRDLDPITKMIVESVEPDKVVFINRGSEKLDSKFRKLCIDKGFLIMKLNETLDSISYSGIDPKYWKVTNKKGHWNRIAHKEIGEVLAKQTTKLIYSDSLNLGY